jgi:dimethylhistidine N-methyltransferase
MVAKSDGLKSVGDRLQLYRAPHPHAVATFADDVRSGLTAKRKYLPPKYLYDDLGSALFAAICELPEYYLTRSETEILQRYAGEVLQTLGGPIELVELGSGSARKTRLVIEEALRRQERLTYHPIDISPGALLASANSLVADYDRLDVMAYASDYFEILATSRLRTTERVLVLFLGSNIGNYEPEPARALLRAVATALRPGDGLLLGADLKKARRTLELAYDDPTGVTAAFNRNLLGRINRELDGYFDLRAFSHVAHYDESRGSVDSFLEAAYPHEVAIGALDLVVPFAAGERIHTESSHKFSSADIGRIAADSGFRVASGWRDEAQRFGASLLIVN